ncbi:U2 small nuclear ribonucleoprotein A' [Monocercomonoides exilis]|uniref:U2 small nuclear ribonucleoprotein A' n=1 Tax=Monocercomonoides exilis TaxID=2049356 RepID=UPI00355A6FD2|nr:U2 small nuclear ribonucleoprotein A' [Monocercomonoides exilis]|eukprot:MONOS_6663.1-p1 / transcript=MONOS_6663.1 / gene=MONOS_6663 / organism=Monocercomonoides_exilis_PA203 / gene_product=U2 small nuclear ribonucleoprotein A' / transcript_product=U2 small nuclear ribonucleoprotein A' / location=Mono_scaffold00214:25833-26637(-) / protein_length=206 / sequence_SO=supercontig / SO=protein_coding / is_pseudo=false
MRLTVEFLQKADSFFNPCGERQLNLRGFKIPAIENFGVLRDAFDAVDLTDNVIRVLGGFPTSYRLKALLLSRNEISHISPNLREQVPKLDTLVLSQNKIEDRNELNSLVGMPITRLVLMGNPIAEQQNYRLYVAHLLPLLKVLDFQKITQSERQQAEALFGKSPFPTDLTSARPKPLRKKDTPSMTSSSAFTPGEFASASSSSTK